MIVSYFRNLIRKNALKETEAKQVISAIEDFKKHPQEWDEDRMGAQAEVREQILGRLMASIPATVNAPQAKMNWAVAASIALVLTTGMLGFQYREHILDIVDPATSLVLKTKGNEIKKLTLSDGSVVWLNGGSVLSYPDRFSHDKREVLLLKGEAYFDIHHDDRKPFRVKAGKTLTNVLGTAFNISSYSWMETIDITVTRGKVGVNNNILLPDDQLAYHKATGKSEKKKRSGDVTLWMQGKLLFNDESFRTVAAILENKYHVNIRFEQQKMGDFRFTARFEPSDSLNDILDALTMTRGLSYEVKGAGITITNNQSN